MFTTSIFVLVCNKDGSVLKTKSTFCLYVLFIIIFCHNDDTRISYFLSCGLRRTPLVPYEVPSLSYSIFLSICLPFPLCGTLIVDVYILFGTFIKINRRRISSTLSCRPLYSICPDLRQVIEHTVQSSEINVRSLTFRKLILSSYLSMYELFQYGPGLTSYLTSSQTSVPLVNPS